MAKMDLKFANAEKEIQKLYKDLADRASKELASTMPNESVSAALRKVYLDEYVKNLRAEISRMNRDISTSIQGGMAATSWGTVNSVNGFMENAGLTLTGAFSHVPTDVVSQLISGKVYGGNWTLSRSLWKGGVKTTHDVQSVVAKGIAEQKSAYDIAKDIEKYLNPAAKKDWEWSKVYPGTNKKVDYSAQRAARTLIQHSYQLSYRRMVQDNPFVDGIIWHSAFNERSCQLCMDRDGTIYKVGNEPLDHPMGLCYLESYIPKSMEEIADELGDWVDGNASASFEKAMNKYVKSAYGGKVPDINKVKEQVKEEKAKKFDVDKAKTIKEIDKAVKNNKWFANKAESLSKIKDLDGAKAIYRAYDKVFKRYPQLVGKIDSWSVSFELNHGTYGNCYTFAGGQVNINGNRFSDWENLVRSYRSDVIMGWHPEGTSAQSIITHEIGHSVDGYLSKLHIYGSTPQRGDSSSYYALQKVLDKGNYAESKIGRNVSRYVSGLCLNDGKRSN